MPRVIAFLAVLSLATSVKADFIAHWPFDGGGTDASGMGNDLTFTGGPGFATGQFGQALDLNGNDQYGDAGDINAMDSPGAFSAAFWMFRRTDVAGNDTNHNVNNVVMAQSSDSSNDNFEIGSQGSNLQLYLDTTNLDQPAIDIPAGISNNTWTHVAVTYDENRTNELEVYVGGALVLEDSSYGGSLDGSDASPFSLGLARPGDDEWGDFDGLIDEAYLFDFALTQQQVDLLFRFNSPTPLTPEPASLALFGLAMLGAVAYRWRKRN